MCVAVGGDDDVFAVLLCVVVDEEVEVSATVVLAEGARVRETEAVKEVSE